MKIFYDGFIFLQQKYGGINRLFIEITKRIPDIDSALMFYCYRFPDSFKKNTLLKREYFMIPKFGGLLKRLDAIFLSKVIKKHAPDIYHTTYYRVPCNLKVKTVVTVYDMIHEKYKKYFGNTEKLLKRKKYCIENADKIITISKNTKNDILNHYEIPNNKVSVTHLAASSIFKEATEYEKNEFKNKNRLKNPFILYVGERKGYKNFITLLKAYSLWKKNKEIDLICAGGDKIWDKEESKIISDSNLYLSVKTFSGVSDKDLRLFYSSALIFIYPSLYEGFGIPILESMACGTPVIVANTSSMPEVAGDSGLYFNPMSKEELLEVLDKVVEDSILRKELISKGLNRSKSFSWEKTALETYSIYKELTK